MSIDNKALTQELLMKLFFYNHATGIFTRLVDSSKSAHDKNTECLSMRKDGYIRISIHNKRYYAHRLAFLYMEGNFPHDIIDHINGNPSDNRWINLRHSSQSQNLQNRHGKKIGCYFYKRTGKWRGQCSVNGKKVHLGYFDTVQEASFAYRQFAKLHHGEFYNEGRQ